MVRRFRRAILIIKVVGLNFQGMAYIAFHREQQNVFRESIFEKIYHLILDSDEQNLMTQNVLKYDKMHVSKAEYSDDEQNVRFDTDNVESFYRRLLQSDELCILVTV